MQKNGVSSFWQGPETKSGYYKAGIEGDASFGCWFLDVISDQAIKK